MLAILKTTVKDVIKNYHLLWKIFIHELILFHSVNLTNNLNLILFYIYKFVILKNYKYLFNNLIDYFYKVYGVIRSVINYILITFYKGKV